MLNYLRQYTWKFLYHISNIEEWTRRKFTETGQLILLAAFVGALFGIDTRKTLGVHMFGLNLSLIFIAILSSLPRIKGFSTIRHLPRYATVRVPMRYRVQITNHTKRFAQFFVVQEYSPDPRPNLTAFLNTAAPWENKVNFLDRFIGYPRWKWLIHKGQRIEKTKLVNLPTLAPQADITIELEITPIRRGVLVLNDLEIKRMDPLGLCWQRATFKHHNKVIVLPQRYPIPPQHPLGRRRLQPGGIALAATVGDSQEFIGLREYRVGDSTRHIHWAAWARSGIPVVKEYQDEFFSRQALILDSFMQPGREEDFEVAISIAASFVEPLTGGDALLDLMFVADQAYTLTGGRGVLSTNALLETLACIEPQVEKFDILKQTVLAQASLLSACVCVFLMWDKPRHELAQNLRELGIPFKIFVVGNKSKHMTDQLQNVHFVDPQCPVI